MSVYKPFSPSDYSIVPFNAHKQYKFSSSSAASNGIVTFVTQYQSQSIDLYSNNSIKYQQLDHLFYKNYITELSNKFGDVNYLKQKRVLNEKANIISIPSGLYGHKIKPNSLFISASNEKIIDDSYGNILLEDTDVNNYITDPRDNIFNIGPVKGFKRYDLNTHDGFIENIFYKKGQSKVNKIGIYNTPSDKFEYDDSYFLNKIYYKNVRYSSKRLYSEDGIYKFPSIDFNGFSSGIMSYHDNKFNFNPNDDFAIEFWFRAPNEQFGIGQSQVSAYILSKSSIKTIVPTPAEDLSNSAQLQNVTAEPQYPFEIIVEENKNLVFKRSDGNITSTVKVAFDPVKTHHIICNVSSSLMSIYKNSVLVKQERDLTTKQTQNNANLYIGSKGDISNYFSGSLSQIKIYSKAFNQTQVNEHYKSSNGSPYIGNIFYSHGLITITHPRYTSRFLADPLGIGSMIIDDADNNPSLFTVGGNEFLKNQQGISEIKFQGSHLIYENEYKCTIDEYEYNSTLNPTVRKNKSFNSENLANFATGSLFKPYITTVGLYNEKNELLVVGKLGQPIRTSNETDTTIVLRWDT